MRVWRRLRGRCAQDGENCSKSDTGPEAVGPCRTIKTVTGQRRTRRRPGEVLRFVIDSFDSDCVHQLACLGGPRLPRPLACVVACITGASLKTLIVSETEHHTLVSAVFENECRPDSAGHS